MSGRNPVPREQSYEGVRATNPPQIIPAKRSPLSSDRQYPLGSLWINMILKLSFQLVDNQGTWNLIGAPAGGGIQTITTPDAVIVVPAAGNVNITQGLNILVTGAGNTVDIAISADPTFTTVTSSGDINSTGGSVIAFGNVVSSQGDVIISQGNLLLLNVTSLISSAGSALIQQNLTVVSGLTKLTNGNLEISSGSATLVSDNAAITFMGDLAEIDFEGDDSRILFEGEDCSIEFNGVAGGLIMHASDPRDYLGDLTLVAGTATIANTALQAIDTIFLQRRTAIGVIGELTYTITPGVSFTVASSAITDISVVSYFIVRTP